MDLRESLLARASRDASCSRKRDPSPLFVGRAPVPIPGCGCEVARARTRAFRSGAGTAGSTAGRVRVRRCDDTLRDRADTQRMSPGRLKDARASSRSSASIPHTPRAAAAETRRASSWCERTPQRFHGRSNACLHGAERDAGFARNFRMSQPSVKRQFYQHALILRQRRERAFDRDRLGAPRW